MGKLEIHSIDDLIRQNYPLETIQKLLTDILVLSLQVKDDYPDYKEWFEKVQVPGIYDGTRNIIIAHIDEKIVGFISLKKISTEKKICTFYVEKTFRRNQIGSLLAQKAVEYLEEERPLITIPMDKLSDFTRIAKKYNWEVTDIKENLYRTDIPEVIVNGTTPQVNSTLEVEKSLKKVYHIYKIQIFKQFVNRLLNNPQKLWK